MNGGDRLKCKKEFMERLRRMMKTRQVSSKIVQKVLLSLGGSPENTGKVRTEVHVVRAWSGVSVV